MTLDWILPLQMLLPMVFAVGLLLPTPALHYRRVAWGYSAVTSIISLAVAVAIACRFDWSHPGDMQMAHEFRWLPALGISFSFGVDSISVLLLLLTALLMPIVVVG